MSNPLLLAFSTIPLAGYFWLLACWHGSRHPRVVAGATDFTLLALGIGALLAFGPFGQMMTERFMPGLLGWVALATALAFVAQLWGRRSRNRLVIYHVDPETLDQALQDVLDVRTGRFRRTIGGFEERAGRVGLSVESSRRLHYAVIEAHSAQSVDALSELRPALVARLRTVTVGPSPVAWMFLALSAVSVMLSLTLYLAAQPRAREALRILFDRLRGG